MQVRNALLPTPARDATTPMLPLPTPPWTERSNTRSGLRCVSSLRCMAGSLSCPVRSLLRCVRGGAAGLRLLDELLHHVARGGSVALELERELRLALRGRPQ